MSATPPNPAPNPATGPELVAAVATVPAGAWAVGVSGGADSVALLSLLRLRSDVSPVIVHLDHQTRGADSAADAEYVARLGARLDLPTIMARRDVLEQSVPHLPKNAAARYRCLRLALFRRTVHENGLQGVLLAHHADDQAETVLQRLLRGSGPWGLTGMADRTMLGDLLILRPLLAIRRDALRAFLTEIAQPWREDASNSSSAYLRNRLRAVLSADPPLTDALLELAGACRILRDWTTQASPTLPPQFHANELAALPLCIARVSGARWLSARGVPLERIDATVLGRLLTMCQDAASPRLQQFPDGLVVRRRQGMISVTADVT